MKSTPKAQNSTKKVHVQRLDTSNSSIPRTPRSSNSSRAVTPQSSISSRPTTPNSAKTNSSEQILGTLSNTRYDEWSKKELVNYYTLKVAEYENEVGNQIQLLKKRKQLLEETKNIKSQLYQLINKRDSLSEEAARIEKEIELLENNNQ